MNSAKDRDQHSASVPVTDVLLTVSNEVRMLSDAAGDLQNLVGNLVVAGAFGGSHSIYELQSLDRLCQSLGAVADFLHGLSGHASPEWKVDVTRAAGAVKLAEVSERLTGKRSECSDATGEFEEFDNWPLTG
ncbi:MAG: hypothetical protein QM780_13460 [Hyphomicrobium sp.]|uniref:hypothetical protein n=1 Tax=Hyphomicrobium sp. TaxID=82 RepID=UPI0039E2B189